MKYSTLKRCGLYTLLALVLFSCESHEDKMNAEIEETKVINDTINNWIPIDKTKLFKIALKKTKVTISYHLRDSLGINHRVRDSVIHGFQVDIEQGFGRHIHFVKNDDLSDFMSKLGYDVAY